MQKPTIELRRISHNKRLSEETPAYTADLYVDGVLFSHVGNHGHGGPDDQRPAKGKTYADIAALEALVEATFPKRTYDFGDGKKGEFAASIESICAQLLDRADLEKMIRRDISRKVMFIKPDDGKLYGIKVLNPGNKPAVIELVKKRHGVARTVNEMTMDEAVAVYERA